MIIWTLKKANILCVCVVLIAHFVLAEKKDGQRKEWKCLIACLSIFVGRSFKPYTTRVAISVFNMYEHVCGTWTGVVYSYMSGYFTILVNLTTVTLWLHQMHEKRNTVRTMEFLHGWLVSGDTAEDRPFFFFALKIENEWMIEFVIDKWEFYNQNIYTDKKRNYDRRWMRGLGRDNRELFVL